MNIALMETTLINSRPQWLERLDQPQREAYFEQELALETSQATLQQLLAEHASIQAYARHFANQRLLRDFGAALDADDIFCVSRYTFDLGSRQVVQEDSRSLTEQFIIGLHEKEQMPEISFKGLNLPSGLDRQWLEKVLQLDARALYGAELRAVYQRADVIAAMKNALRDRLLLSALAARHSGHISTDSNLVSIQRAVAGDSAYVIDGLRLIENTRPMEQILVIGSRQGTGKPVFLYSPDSPGGQTWYECRSLRQLDITVVDWTREQSGRDFLLSRAHALNRAQVGQFLNRLAQRPDLWRGTTLAITPHVGDEVLHGIVENTRAWRVSEEENLRPFGYRMAPLEQRKRFARLQCELKALQTLVVREGGFITYEKFCFDLIKERVEQVLLERGERAVVNPDRIFVDIDPEVQMTLTELIVSETHFYANDAGAPWSYPRFTLAHDHPPVTRLDIRHIASWSRTLRPGEKYIDMLKSTHLDRKNPEGALKRQIHKALALRQMRIGVMHERFHGRLNDTHFHELMLIIDAGEQVDKRPLFSIPFDERGLFGFYIKDRPVVGVFVLRYASAGQIVQFLFTPEAPDGRLIRPYSEFVPSVKVGGLGQYFYKRVMYNDQRVIGTYITDLEQLANFTEQPIIKQHARVTDLSGDYDDLVQQTISFVDAKTESLNEIIFKLVFQAVQAAATIISVAVPPVGIAMSAVLLTKSLWEAADAYNDGDRQTAQLHFLNALIELASLGKAGYSHLAPTKLQKDFIGLLGDVYSVEKFFSQATGQKRLPLQALAIIEGVLEDSQSFASQTTLR